MEKKKKVSACSVVMAIYTILTVVAAIYLFVANGAETIEWSFGIVLPLPAFGLILLWDHLLDKESRLLPVLSIISIVALLALVGLLVFRMRTDADIFPESYIGLSQFQIYLRGIVLLVVHAFLYLLGAILIMSFFGKDRGYKGHIK